MPKWQGSIRDGLEASDAGSWAFELAEIPVIGAGFLGVGITIVVLSVFGFIVLPLLVFPSCSSAPPSSFRIDG